MTFGKSLQKTNKINSLSESFVIDFVKNGRYYRK